MIFNTLIQAKVNEIVFILDYVQIGFEDNKKISILNPFTIINGEILALNGDKAFEHELVKFIGKTITSIEYIEGNHLSLALGNNGKIIISLKECDYIGAEGIHLWDSGKFTVIV